MQLKINHYDSKFHYDVPGIALIDIANQWIELFNPLELVYKSKISGS